MTTTCRAHGRTSVHLSEAEVWKAIAGDAGGSVEAEVTLVAELAKRLMACAGDGTGPGGGMQVRARCRVAVLMLAEAGATVTPVH